MPKKLLDQMRDAIRLKYYSYRTEEAYVDWARRFILFHNKRHPNDMGAPEIQAFLTYLATQRNVAASTQNQALSAILFLYREVLHKEIEPVLLSSAKLPAFGRKWAINAEYFEWLPRFTVRASSGVR
ncbi:MAG: phage integrase N-terminal SAM-like domain-containing protein [Anaerolineaceae bacterium]|nr:phage integrase N-terminal SAM-like domain-containing protein [Anaerolineaceae bacterium]